MNVGIGNVFHVHVRSFIVPRKENVDMIGNQTDPNPITKTNTITSMSFKEKIVLSIIFGVISSMLFMALCISFHRISILEEENAKLRMELYQCQFGLGNVLKK